MKGPAVVRLLPAIMVAFLVTGAASSATVRYVDIAGTNQLSPFTSWSRAATNIQDALDVSVTGDKIWVSNGVYVISEAIRITNGVDLCSVNGPTNTVIVPRSAAYIRGIYLDHALGVVDGFGVRGFSVVIGIDEPHRRCGTGVFCAQGTVRNCIISDNWLGIPTLDDSAGSGVYMANGLLENCVVRSNRGENVLGGGVFVSNGIVRGCAIYGNVITSESEGGGVYLHGGEVRNCVIANNSADTGHDLYRANGVVVNSILWTPDGSTTNYMLAGPDSAMAMWYCRASPLPPGVGNISDDPGFVSGDNADFHLLSGSPCIDTGGTLGSSTQDVDHVPSPLDGNGDGYAIPDIGAYEYRPAAFGGVTNGGVFPSMGGTDTWFTFTVNYRGEAVAVSNEVVVDGTTNAMELVWGSGTNGTYSFRSTMAIGNHSFHFLASDATGGAYRLPSTGDYEGPFVSPLATLSNAAIRETNGVVEFRVYYYDVGQTTPATNYLCIDGGIYVMNLTSGVPANGLFGIDLVVPGGTHSYCFYSLDALRGEFRLPPSGSYGGVYVYNNLKAPTGVVASAGTYTDRIRISWSSALAASGYEVWRAPTDTLVEAVRVATTSGTQFDDFAVTQNACRFYWVRATNEYVQSDFSASALGFVGYPPPVVVAASDGTYADRVAVTWSAVSNVAIYQVWRGTATNQGSAGLLVDNVSATNHDDHSIENGLVFYYWVRSRTDLGAGPFGAKDSGFAPVATPADVVASDGSYTNCVLVSWDSVSRAASYEVWWNDRDDTGSCVRIAEPGGSPYADTDVTPAHGSYYWVTARNELGPSGFGASDYGYRGGTASVPEEIRFCRGPSNTVVFQCESLTGRSYLVESTTNLLGDWVSNSMAAVAGNGRWLNCVTSAPGRLFEFSRVRSSTNN